jgi:hypothetical protein
VGIPAKTSFKTTAFGVRARELIIAGGAGFLGLAVLALPLGSIFIRILVMAALFSAGILYAFWRVERAWNIEEYLFNRWKYGLRSRRFVKGGVARNTANQFEGASIDEGALGWGLSPNLEQNTPEAANGKAAREGPPSGWERVIVWLPEGWGPHSNGELAGRVLTGLALVVFLAWVATTGGVPAIQVQIQLLVSALFRR